jgi:hypothetical protein
MRKKSRKLGAEIVKETEKLNEIKNQKTFEPLTYTQLGEDDNKIELLNNINKIVLNSNSDLSKLTTDDRRDIYLSG